MEYFLVTASTVENKIKHTKHCESKLELCLKMIVRTGLQKTLGGGSLLNGKISCGAIENSF